MEGESDLISHGTGSGRLCLDFANTVDWHSSDHPTETLRGFGQVLEWSRRQGVLDEREVKEIVAQVGGNKEIEGSVMAEVGVLREAIYRIFSATARGAVPAVADMQVLNQYLGESMSRTRIARVGDRFQWVWADEEKQPDMVLWPIAKSAAELLTSDELVKVKECANDEEGCGWLFIDGSKSHSRKWCSMDSCGNRAKFRTYYRTHAGERKAR